MEDVGNFHFLPLGKNNNRFTTVLISTCYPAGFNHGRGRSSDLFLP